MVVVILNRAEGLAIHVIVFISERDDIALWVETILGCIKWAVIY